VLLPLARALSGGRRAWIRYEDAGGTRTDREVEVLGLAWRGGPWHAAAFCHRRGAFRLFRVDRVARARVLRAAARPDLAPPGFDRRFFSTSDFLAPGPGRPVLVSVALRGPFVGIATALFPSALLEWGSAAVVLCHLRATDLGRLASLVASLGEGVAIRHPEAARSLVESLGSPRP
jgi:predicted DNA-binding transcriptional regulator YafY